MPTDQHLDTVGLRERIARIIDPSNWRVLDSYLAEVQRKYRGQDAAYDPDAFQDKASLTKADAILREIEALPLEEGKVVHASEPDRPVIPPNRTPTIPEEAWRPPGQLDRYSEALALVTGEGGKGSTSFVQRKLQIGFNEAARYIERMEREGVVGPNIAGVRKVLLPTAPLPAPPNQNGGLEAAADNGSVQPLGHDQKPSSEHPVLPVGDEVEGER